MCGRHEWSCKIGRMPLLSVFACYQQHELIDNTWRSWCKEKTGQDIVSCPALKVSFGDSLSRLALFLRILSDFSIYTPMCKSGHSAHSLVMTDLRMNRRLANLEFKNGGWPGVARSLVSLAIFDQPVETLCLAKNVVKSTFSLVIVFHAI